VPISAVQKSDPVIHTYIHALSYILSYIIFHHVLSQETGYSSLCYVCSSTSLLIHSKYNSLHLLTPNSQSISLLLPAPFYLAMSLGCFIFLNDDFYFSIIADLQCFVSFLLHSKVTHLHIHVCILFSHITRLHHK